jgi:hypothetical protein
MNLLDFIYGWIFFTRMFWVEKPKGPVYGALLKIIRGCFCEFYIL